jgi:hypothetical protein
MNIHFLSGAVIDANTDAAAGDELDVDETLARALIAEGIAYSLDAEPEQIADTAIAELVDTDGTLAADSDALIASQKATKTFVSAAIAAIGSGLPTADPAVAGALWNDAGTVKVSAGP